MFDEVTRTGMPRDVEDAIGLNRCLVCDSTDTTIIQTSDRGVGLEFQICREHYQSAINVLNLNPFGHSLSRDMWRPEHVRATQEKSNAIRAALRDAFVDWSKHFGGA